MGEERLLDWIIEFSNGVWRGDGWSEEWKEGIIILIVKKEEGRKVEEYRGVTLMTTLYQIYLIVLAEKIKIECEEKR